MYYGKTYSGDPFTDASADYNREVSEKAAELVRNGTTPWDAYGRAADIVERRRREQAQQKKE